LLFIIYRNDLLPPINTISKTIICIMYWLMKSTYVRKHKIPWYGPKVVVEWLTLLLCIQEVPGSNLNPETGYPD
jgi:hypothetical protein